MNGTTIELEQKSEREVEEEKEDEEETQNGWWSREALLKHLESDKGDLHVLDYDEDDDQTSFNDKQKKMTLLHTLSNGKEVVFKRIKKVGLGQRVTVNTTINYDLNAYLEMSDEPFDSTTIRGKPFQHRMSSDSIIVGLYYALLSMREGEVSEVLIHHEVAYGVLGCPPRIPEKASIMYVVQINKVYTEGTIGNYFQLTPEEQQEIPFDVFIEMADTERKSGNGYFAEAEKEGRNIKKKEAGIRYKRAIKILENRIYKNSHEQKIANDLLVRLYANVANTSVALKRNYCAITFSRKALAIDPNFVKAMYHLGRAKFNLGDLDEAKDWMMRARKLAPDSKMITAILTQIEVRIQRDAQESQETYRRMAAGFRS